MLRIHFSGRKLEVFKYPEFKSIKNGSQYKGSEFGFSLFKAVTEIKFKLVDEMEQDLYLRKVVSNTKEDDAIFAQHLQKVRKHIEQEYKN